MGFKLVVRGDLANKYSPSRPKLIQLILEPNCLMNIFDSDKMEQNYFYSAVEPEGSNRIDWNWLKLRSGVW